MKSMKQRTEFAEYLRTFKRPNTYEEVYDVVKDKVSGLYRCESEPIWEIFKDKKIESFVEVGRNLGGSNFFFTCLFKDLKKILSIDIDTFKITDDALKEYLTHHNISHEFVKADSTAYEASGFWDFVFIDGGHTGEIVSADIEIWRNRCKYIGFHDYADKGRKNKHKVFYPDVVEEIKKAAEKYGWKQIGNRGRSEIIFETGIDMKKDFTIVTGCTRDYMKKLKWCLPTWKTKPQFANQKLLIFYDELQEKDFNWVKKYYPDVKLVHWQMDGVESIRELILSSFIFGMEHVDTEFAVKMDSDTYFTNSNDVFDEDDFLYDLVSHRWGYTKPGYWITQLDNYFYDLDATVDVNMGSIGHKRIQSICCLQRVNFVKDVANRCGSRLIVPSHDTTLWYYADKLDEYKWKRKNLRRHGVGHNSRWKTIRESICAHESAFNEFLNEELFKHVQIELTSFCQIGCFNCDRNCGTVRDNEYVSIRRVWQFVEESIRLNHEWSRIDLIGGEPTYHPKLETIIELIKIYKDKYPKCKIRFSTNGLGNKVNEVLKTLPEWIEVRNSNKKSKSQSFDSYNSAPIDNGERRIRACSIPWRCGLGLNERGYFLCGAGASISKVFRLGVEIDKLEDLTIEQLKEQRKKLCKYCGHSLQKSKHVTSVEEISPSWQKAIGEYNETIS